MARLVVASLCALAAWAFANVAARHPVPPSPWSGADLPAPPPPEQNGWVLLQEGIIGTQLPRELAALLDAPPGELWSRAREARPVLERFLYEAATREAVARLEAALAKPRFADMLAADSIKGSHMPVRWAHRVGEAEALERATGGRLSSALALLNAMLRADLDFAATARTPIAQLIAASDLRSTLALAGALLDARDAADRAEALRQEAMAPALERLVAAEGERALIWTMEPLIAAERRAVAREAAELASLLGRLSPEHFDGRRSVISENLFLHRVFVSTPPSGWLLNNPAGEDGADVVRAWAFSIFFDLGATLEGIDARHRAVFAHVTAPSGTPPLELPFAAREKTGWWLLNPMGKMTIDAVNAAWAGVLAKLADARDASFAERALLLGRLGGDGALPL